VKRSIGLTLVIGAAVLTIKALDHSMPDWAVYAVGLLALVTALGSKP